MAEQKTETKALTKADSINNMLALYLPEIQKLAPKHVTPERLLKVMQLCVRKDSKLAQCTPSSLVASLVVASELGLEPGGALGHLYLVPFGDTCTPIIGYRGYVELMRRGGQVTSVRAVVVHAKDAFRYTEGLRQTLEHEPSLDVDPGPMVRVYCVIRLASGDKTAVVMSRAEVDAVRGRSRAGKSGPWVTDYEEMAKKTVVRRAAKLAPMGSEYADAMERDGDTIDGEVIREEALDPGAATEKVKAAVKARRLEMADLTTTPEAGAPPDNVSLPTLDGGREAKS